MAIWTMRAMARPSRASASPGTPRSRPWRNSGRVTAVQAVERLGADRVEPGALLRPQRGAQILAGLVDDGFDPGHDLGVDHLDLLVRPVRHLLENLALRVVEVETVGQTAHHETLHPLVREMPRAPAVQAERRRPERPAGQTEDEHPEQEEGGARACHGLSGGAATFPGSSKSAPGSAARRESNTESASTREARSASPGCDLPWMYRPAHASARDAASASAGR